MNKYIMKTLVGAETTILIVGLYIICKTFDITPLYWCIAPILAIAGAIALDSVGKED